MTDSPDAALSVPVLVGVTGHRDLLPDTVGTLRETVWAALSALKGGRAEPPRRDGLHGLHILTALAEGADQLVAQVALDLGIPLVAVSPMPLARYRETMETAEGRAALDQLWADPGVALRLELPLTREALAPPCSGETEAQARERQDAAQYEQLGLLLSRQSHILLALWNGADPEPLRTRGAGKPRNTRGGSAHVVGMRIEGERDEVAPEALKATPLLSDRPPLLELARSGPVLHVVAPRRKDDGAACAGADGVPRVPGTLLWWSDIPVRPRPRPWWWTQIWPPHETHPAAASARWQSVAAAALPKLIPAELHEVAKLGPMLARRGRVDEAACARHAARLCPDKGTAESLGLECVPERARSPLRWLRRLFAAADVDAVRHQAWLLGTWSLGMPWRRHGWWPVGALLVFALAVPVAAFCFERYAGLVHGGDGGHAVPWLVAYLAAVLVPLLYYGFVVRPRAWQARQQDHRAFAEALRVQFFWALAGMPVAVSDNYLGQQADALGWIRLALRGPALWAAAAALATKGPAAGVLQTRWLRNQREFFASKARENARAAMWMERGARVSVAALLMIGLAQLALHLRLGESPHWTAEAVPLALGVLPALAAFFVITAEGRAYEAHAHAYARAEAVYARALERAETLGSGDTASWRELALALGREALAENAAWLEGHRARPVASRTG